MSIQSAAVVKKEKWDTERRVGGEYDLQIYPEC